MKISIIEKLKTIILFILVTSSILLTYRLWFKSHNLFDILGIFQSREIVNENAIDYIYSPTKILFNFGQEAHDIILSTDSEYKPLQKEGGQLLKSILESQDVEVLEVSRWNELLSSKSFLFGYETKLSGALLAKSYKIEKFQTKFSNIGEFIIVIDNAVSDNIKCYLKDDDSKSIYSVKFNYNDTDLKKLILNIEDKYNHNYVTAHEMKYNFLNDDILLLPVDAVIFGQKAKLYNEFDMQSENAIKDIAHNFFEKYHIVKNIEYMNETKTKVIKKEFIDRSNILRLYDNGKIEYTTTALSDTNESIDVDKALETAVRFVQNNLGFPNNSYISEIRKISDSHYAFSFDYLINGLKLKMSGENIPGHAIEVEVKGKMVSSYIRLVKDYKIEREQELEVGNIKAIDRAIERYRKSPNNNRNQKVNQVEMVYVNSDYANESYPYWFIQIEDTNYYINSINEEF